MTDAPDLYRGVDRRSPPQHPNLLPGWVRPEPPEGYHHLVALGAVASIEGVRQFVWELDYLDPVTGVFASEAADVEVTWPWIEGFIPQAADWDAIGVPHLA